MKPIRETELFKAMSASGDYDRDVDIIQAISEMREEVAEGRDPEEVLHEEGYEPDYVFDLI